MLTPEERIRQVTSKIRRAKEHVAEAERRILAFVASKPIGVTAKRNPQTRQLIYSVSRCDEIPESLALVAGDAIQNLVSALDHLAFQLVCKDTGDKPPRPKKVYFPIGEGASGYEALIGNRMQGARRPTIEAIAALNPYRGGNDLFWMLQSLNNVDKHRTLLLVGSTTTGVGLAQLLTAPPGMFPEGVATDLRKQLAGIFLRPSDRGFPLKEGFELHIGAVDEEPNANHEFRFEVALNEPGIVEGRPLLPTLRQLTTLVDDVVTTLSPLLA